MPRTADPIALAERLLVTFGQDQPQRVIDGVHAAGGKMGPQL
jgi:hypothetical protein